MLTRDKGLDSAYKL